MVFMRDPSKNREDVPRRETPQPRPRVPTLDEAGDFPSGTESFGCKCQDCVKGSPVAEDDPFYATCKCKNFRRYGLFEALRIQPTSSDTPTTWAESGGIQEFTYQGDGIYWSKKFVLSCTVGEGEEAEDVEDEYRYVLNAITRRIVLTFIPPTEGALPQCTKVEAEWCMQGGSCGFRCHCPWVFTVDMPWRKLAPPQRCNVCITPKRQAGDEDYCICTGKGLPWGIKLIGSGFCDIDEGEFGIKPLSVLNGENIFEFTGEQLDPGGGPGTNPWTYDNNDPSKYNTQVTFCASAGSWYVGINNVGLFNVSGDGQLPACDEEVHDFDSISESVLLACPDATLQYELLFDQEVATGSGDSAEDCGPAVAESCHWIAAEVSGETLWTVDVAEENCEDCYIPCASRYVDDECGDAASLGAGTKCERTCMPPYEPDFIEFTLEGGMGCEEGCLSPSVRLCTVDSTSFSGPVTVCGESRTITLEDNGTDWSMSISGGSSQTGELDQIWNLFTDVAGCGTLILQLVP